MATPDEENEARRIDGRLFLALWGAGLVGVVAFLPVVGRLASQLPKKHVDVPTVLVGAGIQSATFLAAAVAAVVFLGRKVGLSAPIARAWAERRPIGRLWRATVGWGVGAGVLGAIFASFAAPDLVAYLRGVPLPARILYGGLVEELILRGGLMTLLTWAAYRLVQREGELRLVPTAAIGIVLSNAVFALGHIPMLTVSHDPSPRTTAAMIFVIALPWGWLYFRRGLEAAFVAHASFHAAVAAIAALH
jgi:hypothetical protein